MKNGKFKQYLAKLGVWGFIFFLVKGLAWLSIPFIIARCNQ